MNKLALPAIHIMEFYLNPLQSYYLINTLFFKKTLIHQENGKIFVIIARNLSGKNKYIVAALLHGIRYGKTWIMYGDIVNGGESILEMGAKPSVDWGTKIAPPSK